MQCTDNMHGQTTIAAIDQCIERRLNSLGWSTGSIVCSLQVLYVIPGIAQRHNNCAVQHGTSQITPTIYMYILQFFHSIITRACPATTNLVAVS